MRISDWSSDVCSSDLKRFAPFRRHSPEFHQPQEMNMERFQERVAIITGGGGRIGSATAQRLASEGAKVVCADLIKEAAEAAAHEIGGDAIGLSFDAADANSVEGLIRQTVSHSGRMDVLHNNAAVTKLDDLDQDTDAIGTPVDVWDQMMVTNVRSLMVD